MNFVTAGAGEVLSSLGVEPSCGLSSSEASMRLETHGANQLPERDDEDTLLMKFLEQFREPLVLMLLASAGISCLLGQFDDAISITLAILIVCTVAFVQEYKSDQALQKLKGLLPGECDCVRDGGVVRRVLVAELVPGDVLTISTGDKLPADCRLVASNQLKVDESSLTGETLPADKHARALPESGEVPVGERGNMVFMGTLVCDGNGRAVVVATGAQTEFGVLMQEMQDVEERKTPLQESMSVLGRQLSVASFVVIIAVALVGVAQGHTLLDMFTVGVSLAVAAIPEGLPICVTVTLALGVQRMAGRNAIVKKMPAVEALGCTRIVCVDKTGTLTKNEMTLTDIYCLGGRNNGGIAAVVEGAGYDANGRILVRGQDGTDEAGPLVPVERGGAAFAQIESLLEAACLCNNATIERETAEGDGSEAAVLRGLPTEGALLVAASKLGIGDPRPRHQRVHEMPFSSDRKCMQVRCRANGGGAQGDEGEEVYYLKGMLEVVLQHCGSFANGSGETVALNERYRKAVHDAAAGMAARGLRVLAVARGSQINALVFSGIVGLQDPPRPGVKEAIESMESSGASVVMITGDAGDTATSIAEGLGMFIPGVHEAVSGAELDAMSDERLRELCGGGGGDGEADRFRRAVKVFYRMCPHHKLRIVRAYQANGDVVAMTGDGVNDAPALKCADIGVAMGKCGTDVAKEAADMVLVDDDFKTMISAVEEGKCIFYNIRNFVTFQLSTSVAALSLVAACTCFGLPNPLNAMQILFINIIMDGPPAQTLGVEPVDPAVMRLPPRRASDPMITTSLLVRVFSSAFVMLAGTMWVFDVELEDGVVTNRDTTMTFTTFVMFDMFNALSCRSATKSTFQTGFFTNKPFLFAIGGSLLGQLLVIYTPPLQRVFQTEALPLSDLLAITALASTVWVKEEVRKYVGRNSGWRASFGRLRGQATARGVHIPTSWAGKLQKGHSKSFESLGSDELA